MSDVQELVVAAGRGEQQAWDALVDRYNGLVWSVARSYRLSGADAADVVQTAWLRLVERLGSIRDPERVGAWLATTARREALRTLRRSARQIPVEDDWRFDVASEKPNDASSELLRSERDRMLWECVDALTDRCRRLLRVLMADPPPHYEEVSAALDMPIGSIGPTRARCLNELRRLTQRAGINGAGEGSSSAET